MKYGHQPFRQLPPHSFFLPCRRFAFATPRHTFSGKTSWIRDLCPSSVLIARVLLTVIRQQRGGQGNAVHEDEGHHEGFGEKIKNKLFHKKDGE